ncbi:MAG: L,D-transpeptidase family protein [Deltaproteobacteria bacterium]|nr:L,D-transpeptidase family protein [Deltaproteobacteria bacterium]
MVTLIAMARLADLRWPSFIDYREQISTFYEAGAYSLAWVSNNQPTPQALALIQLFKAAAEKGLNPDDYDSPRWDNRIARLRAASVDDLMHFDLALTVCAMRYVSALHVGRVNPQHFKFGLDVGPKRYDLTEFLRYQVVYSTDVNAAIAALEPRYAGYARLKAALGVYMKLAAQGDGEAIPDPGKTVRPGDSYSGMTQLVTRLTQLGDASPDVSSQSAEEASIYQGAIVDAVKHFQRRHGLEPDGSIGKGTVAALNTPLSVRVEQLQFALERYRWIPDSFPQPPIMVNIPEFRLHTMIHQPGAMPLDMAVVVGKAYQHRTPVFADYMRYVIFRPYWEVPSSITSAELIPKIRRNPNYLAVHNYIVVDGAGEAVGGGVMGGLLSGAYRIRQKPGPKNSLGLVKFMFPNSYNVYMHGTPATRLFARSRRDFSHGCIRVENPLALAKWVLRDNPEWTEDRIVAAMHGSHTIQVNLTHPIPVLILYDTAVVKPDGQIYFFNDIYGYDTELRQVLEGGYPYPD